MIDEQLRAAINEDGRSAYELAKLAEIETDIVYRFMAGKDIRLATAAKLASVLGLTLKSHKAKRSHAKPT
jgi:predicted transcriptional regulator